MVGLKESMKNKEKSLAYRKHSVRGTCFSCYCYCWRKFKFSSRAYRASHDSGPAPRSSFVSHDLWVITATEIMQPRQAPRVQTPRKVHSSTPLLTQTVSPCWGEQPQISETFLPPPNRLATPSFVPLLRTNKTLFIDTLLSSLIYVFYFYH